MCSQVDPRAQLPLEIRSLLGPHQCHDVFLQMGCMDRIQKQKKLRLDQMPAEKSKESKEQKLLKANGQINKAWRYLGGEGSEMCRKVK